jgi:hypothetical protein
MFSLLDVLAPTGSGVVEGISEQTGLHPSRRTAS